MKNILSIIALVALIYGTQTSAEVLIKINIADPDAVEIYAVDGAVAANSNSDYSSYIGITFLDIIANPQDDIITSSLAGSLRAAGAVVTPYNLMYPSAEFNNSIEVYDNGLVVDGNAQEFVTNATAFFGQSIASSNFLDAFSLKEVGATGNIVAGYLAGDISKVIGQWQIVSEAPAGSNGRITLEEPIDTKVHGGVGNLRGFAFFDQEVEQIEVYLDGEYAFNAPYGGSREDVAAVFPDFDSALNSGFSLAYGYSNLTPGEHTIRVLAIGADGVLGEDTATFNVVGFNEIFIGANAIVDGSDAQISMDGDEIVIESVRIGNFTYVVTMKWRTAEQGFEIIEIFEDL